MPLKPCSFESFYTIIYTPNLAQTVQTVEFILKFPTISIMNHSSLGGGSADVTPRS